MVDETAGVVGESQRVLKVVVVRGGVGWDGVVGMGLLVGFSEEGQEDGFGQKLSSIFTKKGTLGKGWIFCEKNHLESVTFFFG